MECKATTRSGTQCTRKAEPGSKYCWQHQNYDEKKQYLPPLPASVYTAQYTPSRVSPKISPKPISPRISPKIISPKHRVNATFTALPTNVYPVSISPVVSPRVTLFGTQSEEEWEPKSDTQYYGKIPAKITIYQLEVILANGLKAYKADALAHGILVDNEELEGLLDAWFEHDSNKDNKFDWLVTDEDAEQFFTDVLALANA
jgi:hypothetical protein